MATEILIKSLVAFIFFLTFVIQSYYKKVKCGKL